jgi:hypothetical protein
VIEPGSGTRFLGLQDTLVLLPVTQRDYTASTADGADGGPIIAPAPGFVAYLNALALQDCARNANCTLVVTPGGTNVNVGATP